ncbi:MAG: T9SS type A sorting domain-containing protein [Bacteroidetes bacterium]|jgi:hypothetical protein|nr:T9SS type A sorting domain-containing protein [Bacteroidota bacterium]
MRKSLLLGCFIPVLGFGQGLVTNNNLQTERPNGMADVIAERPTGVDGWDRPTGGSNGNLEWLYKMETIGETQYDLQVNGSLANRVMVYPDGKISCVFTMATDGSPFNTRGTGYAHFDGTSWSDMPLTRLESGRAGWPNIGVVEVDGNPVEFVVSHYAPTDPDAKSGGLYIMLNDGIGSTNFTEVFQIRVANNGPLWPRAVGVGSSIHIYAASNNNIAKPFMGIRRPNVYYRYDANGDSLATDRMLLPGYDASRISFGWSDAYQMDQDGENIAIVSGGSGQDLLLYMSSDNGVSWTTTKVDSFPIAAFDGNTSTNGDTLETNSGSVEVLIDNNGKAHVWWNYNRIIDDTDGDSSWSFFPGSNGIIYWNEYTKNATRIAGMLDLNGNNALDLFNDQTATNPGARYSNNTLACFPDAGIDEDGNIYLVYSAPNEEATSAEGPLYRDIYVMYSEDNGDTWSSPQPIVEGYETEDVFCHLGRTVDGSLHIMWQRDDFTGTSLINGHMATLSKIMYAKVEKTLVINESLEFRRTSSSIHDVNNEFEVATAYPNPTSGNALLPITLQAPTAVRVQVTDMLGREVHSADLGLLPAGTANVELKTSGLNSGMYLYKVFVGKGYLSGNLMVE